ncbi:amidohydrolase [Legionella brunensis]|uniref:N-substituted formamide deformylase n=2 Tax=Legionella brunensis TaxID=29422 RepID=A0A0W0S048_9GAMM|nr:amidohydrolase family protein [Legionella brunensis]KTC76847.1 N-substituted formamide deformylase precursor [Legionella brunensis]
MRQGLLTFFIGLAVFLFSLSSHSENKEKALFCRNATTLFTNATFITLDPKQPLASAVAVSQQRLLAVGDKSILMANCRGKDTQFIDLKGAFVIPGFIDTHSQFLLYGWLAEYALDLSTTNVFQRPDWHEIKTTDAFLEALKNRAPSYNGWVIVNGYDPIRIKGTPLDQTMLNNLSSNTPVIVFYSSGNQALLNQAAVQKIATLSDTKKISIAKSGIIRDKSLQLLLTQLIDKENATKAIKNAARFYAQQGYTTVTEAMVNSVWIPSYELLTTQSDFPIDVILTPPTIAEKKRMDLTYQDNPRLYAGPVLIQLDGAAQDEAAFFTSPSLQHTVSNNNSWPASLKKSPRELETILTTSNKEKTPVAIECNGDAAIDLALNIIGKVQRSLNSSPFHTIIINAPFARQDQLQRMQQLGVKVSWFAPHFYYWGNLLCGIVAPSQEGYTGIPLASAQKIMNNLSVQANSPSTPPVPLQMIRILSTGETQNWLPADNQCSKENSTNEQITLPIALKALTLDAALLYGIENDKGSLVPGKLADMTLLSSNPLQANDLQKIKVLGTISRGVLHLNE